MPSPLVTIRAAHGLEEQLSARGDSPQAIALRDLRRYYDALAIAERELGLSQAEWNYLRDILNATWIDEFAAMMIPAEVEDAEPEYGEKWGVDPADLAGRLRTLSSFHLLALVDAIERWWHAQG